MSRLPSCLNHTVRQFSSVLKLSQISTLSCPTVHSFTNLVFYESVVLYTSMFSSHELFVRSDFVEVQCAVSCITQNTHATPHRINSDHATPKSYDTTRHTSKYKKRDARQGVTRELWHSRVTQCWVWWIIGVASYRRVCTLLFTRAVDYHMT